MIARTGRVLVTALAAAALLSACSGGGSEGTSSTGGNAGDAPPTTRVRVARVRRDTLRITVTAPGRTAVLREETVRAPFAGTLTRLGVADGDRVQAGADLGTLVSASSEAALTGARAMMATARTAQDSVDAREAMDLAVQDRVERTLRAPEAGVVLSHAAGPGDRLGEGDEILRLAAAGSVIFQADVSQSDLARVHAGQSARVALPARADTLAGTVHGVLPAADVSGFSAPVRIDFRDPPASPSVGLFGTAVIEVGKRTGALSVPEDAVSTDDVTGTSEVAAVRNGRVHWTPVETGVRDRGRREVSGPGLAPGDTVIVSGQVGLPDSSSVRVAP